MSKRRILKIGIVAARRQLIAVVLVTIAALLLPSLGLTDRSTQSIETEAATLRISACQLLQWTYLLIAVGLALTTDRLIELTADHIRSTLNAVHRIAPEHILKALTFQLGLSTVILAGFAVSTPPELLTALSRNLGYTCFASIGWAGTMSIGVAFFGASTHAILRAL